MNMVLDIRGPVVSTGAGLCCYSTKYPNPALKILKVKIKPHLACGKAKYLLRLDQFI